MNIQKILTFHIKQAFKNLYDSDLETVEFQATRKDFNGDITVVTFPMLRVVKMNPAELGEALGSYLVARVDAVKGFNVVKGFLNIVIADGHYIDYFNTIKDEEKFGYVVPKDNDTAVMVEYSSPNTNKPLH